MARRSRLLIAAAIIGCNGARFAPADATTTDASDESPSFSDVPNDAYYPTVPDAVAPPQFDCLDAGEAGAECPLPPSICIGGAWLEYFDDGQCIDGGCQFTAHTHECYVCVDGGCEGYGGTHAR